MNILNYFKSSSKQIYQQSYRLYQYNDNDYRIVYMKARRQAGWEEREKKDIISHNEESERISLSRTRRNIRELSLSNNFEYFATLTINCKNCDRFSLTQCQQLLRQKLKKLKRKNNNFAYLFITEKHKNRCFSFPPA